MVIPAAAMILLSASADRLPLPYRPLAPALLVPLSAMLAGWLGGHLPALFTTALTVLTAGLLSAGPSRFWLPVDPADRILLLLLTAIGVGISGMSRITGRRVANEEALRESEAQYRGAFENAAIGMAQVSRDGRFLRVNPRLCAITGYTHADLLARRLQAMLHPDDQPADEERMRRLLAGNPSAASPSGVSIEQRWRRRDGAVIRVNVTLSGECSDVGEARHLLAVVEDISARKEAEADLRASEERLQLALQIAESGTWDVDLASGKTVWSTGMFTVLGLEPHPSGKAEWQQWQRAVHPQDLEAVMDEWRRAEQSRQMYHSLHRIVRFDHGEVRWLDAAGRFFFDDSGRAARFVGIFFDVSDRVRTDEALRESEARFRDFADHAPVIVWVTEPDGSSSYISRNWYEFTGQSEDTGVDYGWLDVVHPEDRERVREGFAVANTRQQSFHLEYRLLRADGRWRWALDTAVPRLAAAGTFLGFIGSVIDITERKEAEDAIQRREEDLRAIANAVPALVCAWAPNGELLYANDRWYQYTGQSRADAEGLCWLRTLHPDDAARVLPMWRQDARSGNLYETELRVRDWQGEFHWHAFRAFPQQDRQQAIGKWFGIGVDVDEARRNQEALRESETRFRQIAEAAPLCVWVADANGKVEYYNHRWYELTGQTEAQALADGGTGWAAAIHPDDLPACLRIWTDAVGEGRSYQNEVRVRRHDGVYRWVQGRGLPVRDGEGRVIRWVGANVEIHDRKEAEITLQRANQDLKQFVWAASHDLQEPLRMVVTFTDLLERQYAGALDPQSVQFARFAVEGASRMQVLLKGLRDYWLVTEPADEPAGRIELAPVLEEAIGNLRTAIAETSAEVTADPLPVVPGSHTPLVQLFQNLLSNAIKYRHPQRAPRITIRAARQSWNWLFCVEDNGIGIAEPYHEQVFGIFKRLHRFSDYAGSGIGLALCRTIVERHGGRIWVESQVDVGSRFYFTLPGVDGGSGD